MSNRRIKVLFFLPSLLMGGAERGTVNLIRALDRQRFEPALALLRREGPLLRHVPEDVAVHEVSGRHMRFAALSLLPVLRRVQPDIVCSVMDHTNLVTIVAVALNSLIGQQSGVVGLLQINYSKMEKRRDVALLLKPMIVCLYPKANRLVTISDGVRDDYTANFPSLAGRFQTIYNPVFDDELGRQAEDRVDHPWFAESRDIPVVVGCGRLVKQKGFDCLIQAFSLLPNPVRLVLLGDGPERARLESLAERHALADRVAFLGLVDNPFKYMAKADLFVLSSLWEGLGMVIIEAMACGVPVVATDCPSGPAEVITDGVDGRLVRPPGDPKALAAAIEELLGNPALAARFAREGARRALDFHSGHIAREYEALFAEVAEELGVGCGSV